MSEVGASRPGSRWNALPRLVGAAPPRALLVLGLGIVVLGMLIVFRPLTSLVLLGIYVGVSAIVSGILELAPTHRAPRWWNRIFAVAWILGGIAVIVWLGRSLDFLPATLAVLLIIGGIASLGDAIVRGRVSERILAAAWGGAQIVLGTLSLTWPDVTLLVVAVVFGVRTIVLGAALVIRGGRALAAERAPGSAQPARPEPTRRARAWTAAGRYALSVLLVVTAAGGWWLNDWLEGGAPVIDAFYDPPADVPDGHGRLLRVDAYPGRFPEGGEVRRILYTTRDALGRPAVASGIVIIPTPQPAVEDGGESPTATGAAGSGSPSAATPTPVVEDADASTALTGPRPVVIWNHGTTGVARGCAPSLRDDAATKWAIPGLEDALARGWVVVASDYSGQGAPGTFPYLIGKGEARSSLDAVLAAGEIEDLVLSPDTVVWGHSQGGHAALWTSEIAADYTPGIDVRGTAALAPVTDPLVLAEELARGGGFELSLLTSWVLVPYADTYPEIDLDDYVASGARTIVREMTQRCPSEPGVMVSVAAALGVSEDVPLYSADLTAGALGKRLAQNAASGPWEQPLLLGWGSADEVIPPRLQRDFVADLCAQGQPVRWIEADGITHQQILQPRSPFLPTLLRWTGERFDRNDSYINGCGR